MGDPSGKFSECIAVFQKPTILKIGVIYGGYKMSKIETKTKYQEILNLKVLLEDIEAFFAPKIQQDELTLMIEVPRTLSFMGDFDFMLPLLINIIGKPLYRTPQGEKIIVSCGRVRSSLCIDVYDRGYPRREFTESLIEDACDIFISEPHLQKICQENGFMYQYSQIKYRLNRTQLIVPFQVEQSSLSNVVRLFSWDRTIR